MTRVEPHTGACSECGALIIAASVLKGDGGYFVTLDATPSSTGAYRAWYGDGGWLAQPASDDDTFRGMRRAEHVCVVSDKQLEIGAA